MIPTLPATMHPRIAQLVDLRHALLSLHQALITVERNAYERFYGRVSSEKLLQLLIDHPQFDWLHRLSELIVQIDTALQADDPITPAMAESLIVAADALLTPAEDGTGFARQYFKALQRDPAVVMAHATVAPLLSVES